MRERLLCIVLVAFGFAFVGTEILGVHEFMWEKYGKWNYLMIGSVLVTAVTAVLPLGAEAALRHRRYVWCILSWMAIPVIIAFVFSIGFDRTGSSADQTEEARQKRVVARDIANQMIEEAKAQKVKDQKAIDDNCGKWGPNCTQAKADLRATEAKLQKARDALLEKSASMGMSDSMTTRIIAFAAVLGFNVSKEQVQTFHPMMLPMLLGMLGPILVGLGIAAIGRTAEERKLGRLSRLRLCVRRWSLRCWSRVWAHHSTTAEPTSVIAAMAPPSAKPPKPRLVAASDPLKAHVYRIMELELRMAKGKSVPLADCFLRFAQQRRGEGGDVCTPDEFMLAMIAYCRKREGIQTEEIDGQPWIIGAKLLEAKAA